MIRKIERSNITKRERMFRFFEPDEQEDIRNWIGHALLDPLVKIEEIGVAAARGKSSAVFWQLEGDSKWQIFLNRSSTEAVRLCGREVAYWLVKQDIYVEKERLNANEVWAIVVQQEQAKQRKIKRALATVELHEGVQRREPIPDDVKIFVWRRDQGRCVKCGSNRDLEFDHIIPHSQGGSSTARNIQLLCAVCNKIKGPNLI